MTDEKAPRIRGQKERDAAYRAGFADGLAHAHAELSDQRVIADKRKLAMEMGLNNLRAETPVKRRRRGPKPEKPDANGGRDPEAPTRPGMQGG